MNDEVKLTRAQFLRLSAITAISAAITACTQQAPAQPAPTKAPAPAPQPTQPAAATKPPAPAVAAPTFTPAATATTTDIGRATAVGFQGKYKEAPQLAELVKQGKLDPVEKRLPEHPYVVPHKWLSTGKYGGWLQQMCSQKTDQGTWQYIQESMYGHSLLRWLKDGLEIGPGLVETWEVNQDASVWTLHFRKGLRWSNGDPWTVDDILFWWEDEVQTPDLKELPPDEGRSGKGTLMTMKKIDDYNLQLIYDAPTPLTADRLAMWVKRGNGPRWMDPKNYLKQFHPKYNPSVDKTKWVDDFILKRHFAQNPDCPTMTGWKLRVWNKGQNTIWERNPYYWCIDKEGNQLPYIDGITMTNVQDPQVFRLRLAEGKADYVHGGFTPLTLADVSTLKAAEPKHGMEMWFWDGGGGGNGPFFSQDYFDEKYRKLFRDSKGRWAKAMSHAINRPAIQKAVYYGTGELTTGTLSPKAFEFHVPGGEEVYALWRDTAKDYNPDKAKKLLDELGVVDKNGDGWRELPDGSSMLVTLDYHSDQDPNGINLKQDEMIAKDWQAIGINAKLNPIPPASWDELWGAGKIMCRADWGYGDGPNLLVYPQWLVPIEFSRWSPLQGRFYEVRGTPKEKAEADVDPYKRTPPRMEPEKGGPIEKLWNSYDQTKIEPDQMKRTKLVWDMIKIHNEAGPFFYGIVANTPMIVMVRKGLKNVPKQADLAQGGFTGPWIIPSPAVYDPETYYWESPEEHKGEG